MEITAKEAFEDISLVKLEYEYISGPRIIYESLICNCCYMDNKIQFYKSNMLYSIFVGLVPLVAINEDKSVTINGYVASTDAIIDNKNVTLKITRYKLV